MCPSVVTEKTRAEKTTEEALTAVHGANRAIEAEAAAMIELEKAYRKANDTAAELKNAIKANQAAKLSLRNAQNRAREAIEKAKRTTQAEARADKDEERKLSKWRALEAKAAEAEKVGKQFNKTAVDEARREAKEAEQKAATEQLINLKAKEASVVAEAEVKAAEKESTQAEERVRKAKEAEAVASAEVPRAEDLAQRAIKVAKSALEDEASAKKTMDQAIRRLKALMASEAKGAPARGTTKTQTGIQETAQNAAGTAHKARRISLNTSGASSDIYSGTVKLLIASPADSRMVQRFQERLAQTKSFRVKSVCGGEGTDITILAEQPIPLVGQLREIEVVDRVSRISRKEIEVALKPVS